MKQLPTPMKIGFWVLALMCFFTLGASAQDRRVSGQVIDDQGQPMPGTSIIVKGETRGVISDGNGNFEIAVKATDVLVFEFLGYQKQEVPTQGKTTLKIVMQPKADELDEVTVVAFSKQKKESVIASVSTVNPTELKVPSSNLTTALAGRASGIISYQVSGEPGQDNAQFFIRGISSFGASAKKDPLILIDNIEVTSTDLARLTPDDIASFSVMKDATAAALYGARGANGVILITTKNGVEGKAKLNVRYELSLSEPTTTVDLADPITYMTLHNEAVKTRNPTASVPYSQEKIAGTRKGENPNVFPANDWYNMLFKDVTVNHRVNFNLSGGGAIANYYISGAYSRDNGVLKSDNMNNFKNNIELNRYVLRANFNVKVTNSTTVTARLHGAFDDYSGPLDGGSAIYEMIMNSNPVAFPAVFTPDEVLTARKHTMFGRNADNSYTNPYAEMVRGYKQYSTSTMLAQVEIKQDLSAITEGLSIRALANTNRYSYFDLRREMTPYYYTLGTYDRDTGVYTVSALNEGSNALSYVEGAKDVNSSLYLEAAADYNRTFNDKHNVTGLLVYTMQHQLYGNAGDLQGSLPYRNMGLAGRFTYSYDSRYFVEANFGYNGSERFDKNHRWGFFPSAGLGYIVSNETFYPESLKRVLSLVKLKATYGLVGNDAIGSGRFFYLSNVNLNDASQSISFGTLINTTKPGVTISQYANPNISWEISRKMNLGLELGLWDDALSVQLDYFTENRSNILMTRSYVPSSAGFEADITANVGEAQGRGFEAALQFNHSFNKDMWLTATGNFTYATSEYKIYEEPDYSATPWLSHVGHSLGQTYGYVAERLFVDDREVQNSPTQNFGGDIATAAGDIKYKDINGDGEITTLDRVPIGYPYTPEVIYGFGASFGWKGFDISLFFQGSARSSFWIDPTKVAPFINGQRALLTDIANSVWTEENRDIYAFWPRLSETLSNNNTQTSTWYMRDGSFLRLKSAEIGYTLPSAISKKAGIETARIYVSGSNLLTFSKFKLWDPEMKGNGLGYPVQRVYNIGVQINF